MFFIPKSGELVNLAEEEKKKKQLKEQKLVISATPSPVPLFNIVSSQLSTPVHKPKTFPMQTPSTPSVRSTIKKPKRGYHCQSPENISSLASSSPHLTTRSILTHACRQRRNAIAKQLNNTSDFSPEVSRMSSSPSPGNVSVPSLQSIRNLRQAKGV